MAAGENGPLGGSYTLGERLGWLLLTGGLCFAAKRPPSELTGGYNKCWLPKWRYFPAYR